PGGGPTAVRAAPPRRATRARRGRARWPPPAHGSGAVLPGCARDHPRGTPAPPGGARAPTADPASLGSSLHQREQLELHLARPPAQARELDVAHAPETRLCLHAGHPAPPPVPHHL